MSIKDELLFDFSINMPRIMISGKYAIIDFVKRIVIYSENRIIIHNGRKYIWVIGRDLNIIEIRDERVIISGEFERFEILDVLHEDMH